MEACEYFCPLSVLCVAEIIVESGVKHLNPNSDNQLLRKDMAVNEHQLRQHTETKGPCEVFSSFFIGCLETFHISVLSR